MAQLTAQDVISEFEFFGLPLKEGTPILNKLLDIGQLFGLDADTLLNEWVAFSSQNNSCQLGPESLDIWEGHLQTNRAKGKENSQLMMDSSVKPTFSEKHLDELFPTDSGAEEQREDIMSAYGTPKQRLQQSVGRKRTGATIPVTPPTQRTPTQNITSTPSNVGSPGDNSLLTKTPSLTYQQRKNAGHVLSRVNDGILPTKWVGLKGGVQVKHYNGESVLNTPYQHMFQKVSEKALILLERIEKMGAAICDHHDLLSPLSVSQPSLEPAIFTGQVVCEGEGHLNVRSCLLQGPSHSRWNKGARVRMEIPDNISCSLFPGQIIAVEGINNYNGMMVVSRIWDEGVVPPEPIRRSAKIQPFTMLCAAGPFTTTDNLNYQPLQDMLAIVREEKPDVLVLLGPFLDDTHPQIKSCEIPGDTTFDSFFLKSILEPLCLTVRSTKTKLIMIPSQHDVHHPHVVYPQPPFKLPHPFGAMSDSCYSDPCTLDVNGLVLGVSSTDILFHLSAKTMFKGPVGDRMARLASHILQQQCYYPLMPAYQREDFGMKTTATTQSAPESLVESSNEVNLDLIHMFEDNKHALLPVRPDLLLLSSSLKPFAKVIDGCMVINPGRLTKRNSGGTFMKLLVKDYSNIGIEVVSI